MTETIRRHGTLLTRAIAVLTAPVLLAGLTHAQPALEGWRQWGGPTRNFKISSAPIARTWPASGPRQLWRRALGEGYSSVLADEGTLVTMYRREDSEIVVALDAATGATRWEHAYSAPLTHNGYFDVWLNAAGPGPYSTPLIADGTVFSVGVTGKFHALDLRTGALRWSNNRMRLHFGSALRMGGLIIGASGDFGPAFLVALNAETGAEVWRDRTFARAQLVDANGTLIIVDEHGEIAVASVSSAGLQVHARKDVLTSNTWTPPTVVGSTLYVRDRKNILALDLSEQLH